MVILGLILVLVALALGAALLLGTQAPDVAGQDVDIKLFDAVTITLDPLALVVAGMATMLLLWLGLVLIKAALTRRTRQRRQRKEQELAAKQRLADQEAAHHEEVARRDRELQDQRVSTEIARERAEVAERHDPTLTDQPTERIDTGVATPGRDALGPDATRPIRRDPRS